MIKAKTEWCGVCSEKKTCKAVYLPDMGGWEDWVCKPCREDLKTVQKVKIL